MPTDIIPLLGPVVALVAWTLFMLVWLAVKRAPYVKDRNALTPGARGSDVPPGPHNWPAHNYTHLLEQPTLFYAIVLVLALLGDDSTLTCYLAWAYVALRVVHSLIQATVNIVKYRFLVFMFSTLCLGALTVRAALLLNG